MNNPPDSEAIQKVKSQLEAANAENAKLNAQIIETVEVFMNLLSFAVSQIPEKELNPNEIKAEKEAKINEAILKAEAKLLQANKHLTPGFITKRLLREGHI